MTHKQRNREEVVDTQLALLYCRIAGNSATQQTRARLFALLARRADDPIGRRADQSV